jgi:hypothetical protein
MHIDLKSSVEFCSAAFEIIKIQPEGKKRDKKVFLCKGNPNRFSHGGYCDANGYG